MCISMSEGAPDGSRHYWLIADKGVCLQPVFPYAVHPVTSVTPEAQVVEEGMGARIECHVTGTPLPTVQWRDADNRLIPSSREGM